MIVTPGQDAAAVVDRVLADARAMTLQTLLELIPRDPRLADFYETVAEYPRRASKAIRPALCLAACRAHGGSGEDAIGAATAIELMHSAFLVHDDICDGATRRRGAPALHVRHGLPLALTAGDALAWLALEPLLASADRLGGRLALDVLAELQHMTRRTIEGQAAELAARERPPGDLGPGDYLRVVLDKTCWYSAIHPCRIGALIGSRGQADLDAIARFGFFLGAVLQIRDDIENVTDRDERGGKDFGGDVIEGKPTLMLIHLRDAVPAEVRQELDRLVGGLDGPGWPGGPGRSGGLGGRSGGSGGRLAAPDRVDRVVGLMQEYGSIDYACAFADGLAGAALAEFDAAMGWLPESEDKLFLRSLALHLRDPAVRGR